MRTSPSRTRWLGCGGPFCGSTGFVEIHRDGGKVALIVLTGVDLEMVARIQVRRLHGIAVFIEELGVGGALQAHQAGVVRFENHLLVAERAQLPLDTLRRLGVLFGILFLAATRRGAMPRSIASAHSLAS